MRAVCQLKSCSAPVSATCSLNHTLQHFSSATRFRSEITERKVWCVLFALYLSGHGYLSPQQQTETLSEIMWVWKPGYQTFVHVWTSLLNHLGAHLQPNGSSTTRTSVMQTASLTSWTEDMTADTEEVKGQSACFSHPINPVSAPDSSVLSVLEGGDCAWLTGTNRWSIRASEWGAPKIKSAERNLQVLICTMENSYMLIINFLAS